MARKSASAPKRPATRPMPMPAKGRPKGMPDMPDMPMPKIPKMPRRGR